MSDADSDVDAVSQAASDVSDSGSESAASSADNSAPHNPGRPVVLPSLFSRDPLSLSLSFALIDLPVALGQPYFPKELVRLVHDYASEPCIIVQLENPDDSSGLTLSSSCSSSAELVTWLAMHLPDDLCPALAMGAHPDEVAMHLSEEPTLERHCARCLVDEMMQREYGKDISLLLHAQLRDNEYRQCPGSIVLEVELDGEPFDPAQHACLDAIRKRFAAIQARGQKPVAVGLNELLKRVRLALWAGRLPRGMSSRPCDWAPLFWWIRSYQRDLNERREAHQMNVVRYNRDRDEPSDPLLCAVLLQSSATMQDAPVIDLTQARLWSHDKTLPVLINPAQSMIIADETEAMPEQASSSSSSSASSSSAAARPSS